MGFRHREREEEVGRRADGHGRGGGRQQGQQRLRRHVREEGEETAQVGKEQSGEWIDPKVEVTVAYDRNVLKTISPTYVKLQSNENFSLSSFLSCAVKNEYRQILQFSSECGHFPRSTNSWTCAGMPARLPACLVHWSRVQKQEILFLS